MKNVLNMTFEEAGLTLIWVGNLMRNRNLCAVATLDFDGYEEDRTQLIEHLIGNGIDQYRAAEIANEATLDDLTSLGLFEE